MGNIILTAVLNFVSLIIVSYFSAKLLKGRDDVLNNALSNYELGDLGSLASRKILEDAFFKCYNVKLPGYLIIEIAYIKPNVSDSFSFFSRAAVRYDATEERVVRVGLFSDVMPIIAMAVLFLLGVGEAYVSYSTMELGLTLWSKNSSEVNFIFSSIHFGLGLLGAAVAFSIFIFVTYNCIRIARSGGFIRNKKYANRVLEFLEQKGIQKNTESD